MPNYIFLLVISYLVGSIPFGVLISRLHYKIDVRNIGSGNIGATNIARVFGWKAGVFIFSLDFLKGWGVVYAASRWAGSSPTEQSFIAVAAVLGHCYSLFIKFEGGKGVATSFGVLVALEPSLAIFGLIGYVFGFLISRVSAVGSMVGGFCATVTSAIGNYSIAAKALVTFVFFITLIRHQQNIRRLWKDNDELGKPS